MDYMLIVANFLALYSLPSLWLSQGGNALGMMSLSSKMNTAAITHVCIALAACSNILSVSASSLIGFLGSDLQDDLYFRQVSVNALGTAEARHP